MVILPSGYQLPQDPSSVEGSLTEAERKGFRLAVIGRTIVLFPIAIFYLTAYGYPNNVYVAGLVICVAVAGMAPLALVGGRNERMGRYALFTFDVFLISAVLALAPISSGGDIPQNMVFRSSRGQYYFVVVAVSALTLSPALVLWTGLCSVAGLAAATAWIAAGMDRIVGGFEVMTAPSREAFLAVVLDPDFLGLAAQISEGVKVCVVTGIVALAVHRARDVVRAHAVVEIKRSHIQRLFGRYVPAQVAEQLIDSKQLLPQTREASIIFADIEGFTHLSETLPPPQVIGLLNRFFGAATEIVDEHGGVVVNYVGDALIASFNAPLPMQNYATHAVNAARALISLVAARDFDGHHLRLRIGISTGPIAGGTVGGAERQSYTLYGDTVNVAQRLERMNKDLGTTCLICSSTYTAAQSNTADAVDRGALKVAGRDRTVEVFSLGDSAFRMSGSAAHPS